MAEKQSKQRQIDRQNYAQLGQDLKIHRNRAQTTPESWESTRIIQASEDAPSSETLRLQEQSNETPLVEDPWKKGKEEYRVNVSDLLKWEIASDTEHEHTKGDHATMFLML